MLASRGRSTLPCPRERDEQNTSKSLRTRRNTHGVRRAIKRGAAGGEFVVANVKKSRRAGGEAPAAERERESGVMVEPKPNCATCVLGALATNQAIVNSAYVSRLYERRPPQEVVVVSGGLCARHRE